MPTKASNIRYIYCVDSVHSMDKLSSILPLKASIWQKQTWSHKQQYEKKQLEATVLYNKDCILSPFD